MPPTSSARPERERLCVGVDARRGVLRAHMEVELVNDGPVTVLLEQGPTGAAGSEISAPRAGGGDH